MRSTYKKPLALLLSAALSFTLSGSPVYASNSSLLPETGTRSALPAQTATSSNAVENQEPVVSVDYISGTKEFTDIFEALDWIVPGVTFTLLRDTTITRQLKLDANVCDWDNITFDLNGYTLSGNFDDEAVVYFDPATAYHVAFKNGTIENTAENGTAVQLWDGQITMENVTINGDFVIKYDFLNLYKSYTPTFLGGGTISKLRTESENPANFGNSLAPGCYFVGSDGRRVQGNALERSTKLENVTVMTCEHENGFVRDPDTFFTRYICPVCGNACTHDTRSSDDRECEICHMKINDIVYNPGETEYVTSFNDATTAANPFSSRILLLSDQDSSSNFIRDHMTVDFNGHTMTWTGSYGNTTVSLSGTGVTFLNTGTSQGHFIGTINLWGSSPRLIIPAGANLLIDALEVKEGTASLSGGTFGTITVSNGNTLNGLLAPGYCYVQNGQIIVPSDSDTKLTNVSVVPCDHTSAAVTTTNGSTITYKCPCGEVTYTGSVTKDGKTLYYADLQDALDHASGGTFHFLTPSLNTRLIVPDNVTIDFTNMSLYHDTSDSELVLSGRVTLLNRGTPYALIQNIPIVVQSGGTLIVPKNYSISEENQLDLSSGSSITIEPGGHAELYSGTYSYIYADTDSEIHISGCSNPVLVMKDDSRAVLTGGSYRSLYLEGICDVKISGGSYGRIEIYETDLQSALVRPKVTYADFSALLTNGSGFQKSDGSWLSKNDVTSSPEYMNRKSKYIEDVTAVDAPVQDAAVYARISGTEYKESVNVQYKARTGREFSLMPDIHFRSDVTPSASCQWYQVNSDGSMTEIEDASDMALHLSPTIPVGTYTYAAEITCGGYICYSDPYTVTVTPRELELTVDEDFISKVYDGTANVPDIKPIFIAAGGGDLPDADEITCLIGDSWYFNSPAPETPNPDFSDEKGVSFLCTLTNPNYSFAGGETEKRFFCGQAPYIKKATASNAKPGTMTVLNHTEAAYRFDLSSLLPELDTPKKYGTVEYHLEDVALGDYYDSGASICDGVLTLPVRPVDSALEQQIGTVTVKVISQNYHDFLLTLQVSAVNNKLPDSGEDNKPGGNSGGNTSGGGNSSSNGSNSGGNSSSDSDSDSSYEDTFLSSDYSGQAQSKSPSTISIPSAVPDKNGNVTLDHNMIQFAIKAARKTVKKNGRSANGIAVSIPVVSEKSHSAFSVTISARILDTLIRENVTHLALGLNGASTADLDADLLRWLDARSADADILIRIQPAVQITGSAKPAYTLSVFLFTGGKETPVTDFGNLSITIK
ncbi:hypothetical protein DW826_04205 [Clostridium sp. AM34-11AC]|uniref:hypothetical protein n=1 Tax=Clostridium sp. AM34-11AC TaxID=2305242 RepID=UPI000E41B3A0|nr:hypothetical protein [Clostridium sp. AM34-11AC]RGE08051.1 hypothetical protein DW826_04205 [Clostridium sp. AM34-11AC]